LRLIATPESLQTSLVALTAAPTGAVQALLYKP